MIHFLMFLSFVALHIIALKLLGKSQLIVRSFALATPFLIFNGVRLDWMGAWIFLSLLLMYMVVLISSTNSLTLRMVDEMSRLPNQEATADDLEKRFSRRESLESRLKMMENRVGCSKRVKILFLSAQKGGCLEVL